MTEEIKGPLDIWTYPVLNTLVAMSSSKTDPPDTETASVVRDSDGEVQEIVITHDK